MLVTNGSLLTFDPENPFIESGALRINEGRILDMGGTGDVKESPRGGGPGCRGATCLARSH